MNTEKKIIALKTEKSFWDRTLLAWEQEFDNKIDKTYIFDNRIFVITDDDETEKLSLSLGAECPFKRPDSLSKNYGGLEAVFQYHQT